MSFEIERKFLLLEVEVDVIGIGNLDEQEVGVGWVDLLDAWKALEELLEDDAL